MASSSSYGGAASSGRDEELGDRLGRWVAPQKLPHADQPGAAQHAEERAERRAEPDRRPRSRRSPGSMAFVYLHVIWFGCWIGFGVENYPFGLLTMIVSLEAIFLSTFVMISQNRADAKRQVIADQQWKTVQEEDQQNEELLDLSKQILALTKEVRSFGDTIASESDRTSSCSTSRARR